MRATGPERPGPSPAARAPPRSAARRTSGVVAALAADPLAPSSGIPLPGSQTIGERRRAVIGPAASKTARYWPGKMANPGWYVGLLIPRLAMPPPDAGCTDEGADAAPKKLPP